MWITGCRIWLENKTARVVTGVVRAGFSCDNVNMWVALIPKIYVALAHQPENSFAPASWQNPQLVSGKALVSPVPFHDGQRRSQAQSCFAKLFKSRHDFPSEWQTVIREKSAICRWVDWMVESGDSHCHFSLPQGSIYIYNWNHLPLHTGERLIPASLPSMRSSHEKPTTTSIQSP